MKKSMLFTVLLTVASVASAQWFDFSNNSKRIGIGFHIGEIGMGCEYSEVGGGASLNVCGVYVDFAKAGPEHKWDNHVTNTLYDDSVAFTINLGYQIPVLKWLRVMPIIGYCQTNAGKTDATSVNVDVSAESNSASIYHDYEVTSGTRRHRFNFGIGLSVRPLKWFDIYAVGSRNAVYGGLSLNLNAFASSERLLINE